MRHLVSELRAHAHSWPFHEAVNAEEVTDYYDVITEPMGKYFKKKQKRSQRNNHLFFFRFNYAGSKCRNGCL